MLEQLAIGLAFLVAFSILAVLVRILQRLAIIQRNTLETRASTTATVHNLRLMREKSEAMI